MALTFGVTVLPDPPASRLVELMALGERNGFEIGWTYDSHVLWQDSFPVLTLAVQGTTRMKFGHLVTNPGTREPTVVASSYATLHDISDGRMVMGIGRGDSARRYIGQKPVRVAEFEAALRMMKPFMNGEEVVWNEKELHLKWVRPGAAEDPDVGRRVRAEGTRRRRPRRRRRDHPARRPRDHPVDHGHCARSRRGGGRDPAELKCIVCAPSHVGPSRTAASRRAGSRRWSPTTCRT